MRQIGKRIKEEQNLSDQMIKFLIVIAYTILHAFSQAETPSMKDLALELEVSRTTLYKYLRLTVKAVVWFYHHKKSPEMLTKKIDSLKEELKNCQKSLQQAQKEIDKLTAKLFEMKSQISSLQVELANLKEQWILTVDRLIIVLKMSGRCTVRGIVEVLEYGCNVKVSVGYVQGIITQAGINAGCCWQKLQQVLPFSGAISIDEVFLKEKGKKILGIVIVDPASGLILHLERATERSALAIESVITNFKKTYVGIEFSVKLCLTDMYKGYLAPVRQLFPFAVHQFCWFHINCFHIGATVRRARKAYEKALKALTNFDQKNKGPLDEKKQAERNVLLEAVELTKRLHLGCVRFQRLLMRVLSAPNYNIATMRLDRLIRVGLVVNNPYIQKMARFLSDHRERLLSFYICLENKEHLLQRLSRSLGKWVDVTKRWAIPITTNSAEHVFRCLRRYTKNMEQFGSQAGTERFFDLFSFFHNVHILRAGQKAGQSLLAHAHIDLVKLFGCDDPYTILGFPPSSQPHIEIKNHYKLTHQLTSQPTTSPRSSSQNNILIFPTRDIFDRIVQSIAA